MKDLGWRAVHYSIYVDGQHKFKLGVRDRVMQHDDGTFYIGRYGLKRLVVSGSGRRGRAFTIRLDFNTIASASFNDLLAEVAKRFDQK